MKRTHNILPILPVVLLAAWATPATATPATPIAASGSHLSALLEQAIFTEETLGNLDEAIGLYQEIVSKAEAERSFAAQAQIRLGKCYLKKGEKDAAIAAFQSVVEGFPHQRAMVAEARARLSELGFAPPEPGVQLRRVWDNPGALLGSPSADGRQLTFTDWTSGDLAIHDFETGADRRLTAKGSWASPEFAEFSVLSPDGKHVAYSWWTRPRYELRVVGVDGREDRLLYRRDDTLSVAPIDWSPDGQRILSLLARKAGEQLAWISLADGSERPVGRARDFPDGKIDLSPDGRWIVFDDFQAGSTTERDLFLIDVESGAVRPIVEHPADERVLGWSPDGDRVLFGSDRTGEWGAWAIRIADGRPTAEPELLKADFGGIWPSAKLFPLGFESDGSFYYGILENSNEVYVASLGANADEVAPVKVTQSFEGSNTAPDWSSDGKGLAWLSKRGGSFVLVIRDLASGQDREVSISSRMTRILTGGWGGLRWSPDGATLVVAGMARPQESWQGIFAIDAKTGEVEEVVSADPETAVRIPLWDPDGKSLLFVRGGKVFARDLESGAERLIAGEDVGKFALSPDGGQLALTTDSYRGATTHLLKVVSTAGGEVRELFRSKASEPFHPQTPLAWTPDGRYLLVGTGPLASSRQPDPQIEVWRIPLEGGEPERTGVVMPNLVHLRVHPDGRRIAFEAGVRKTEIWALENFLPEAVASR